MNQRDREKHGVPYCTGRLCRSGAGRRACADDAGYDQIYCHDSRICLFFAFAVLAVQFQQPEAAGAGHVGHSLRSGRTVLALFLTGIPLGATLIIGILVVIALTVIQGVLLITFTESLRINDELPPQEAIITAAKLRLRPVLMLSFCFIAGLIPLALNIEEGGDMLQPMAAGAIGGLALGLMVTLFLLPSCMLSLC
jgi:multidrug efflux pump subunit AcrB